MSGNKVQPLKSRTMTLNELQLQTLNVLRLVKFQLQRQAHEDGMSDSEFVEQVIEPLETVIHQDRHVLRMHRQANRKASP